ncbi:MAG: formyltransferase family protein [Bradyrhizobium sp.]|uniref:formyltransferase family protein n=1 Tax=Bradyrhizobium sp. TaxID=376 RepID=UPI00299F99CB|nr:formyltransferase family protein [Bradyrhizobium sp.]MDX3966848.1 formyltransferase family protein [Bradyrhizobium sp.]
MSKFGHCLNDLLHRWSSGALKIDVKAVVSNHEDLRPLAEWYGVPYHYLPVDKAGKARQEAASMEVVKESGAELVVLARYMQVLSAEFAQALSGRCINIPHSFLPSFKGARPYHQAHVRGEFGEAGLDRLIARRERETPRHYEAAMNRQALEARIETLATLRAHEGYMAEWQRDEDGSFLFIENHCPICTAARACRNLCRSKLATFQKVLGASFSVERVDHLLAGARRCAYRISAA